MIGLRLHWDHLGSSLHINILELVPAAKTLFPYGDAPGMRTQYRWVGIIQPTVVHPLAAEESRLSHVQNIVTHIPERLSP